MTSEIDKLKHFHVENYRNTNFTDDLNDGEEFLYTTIRCKDAIKELKLAGYGNGAFTKRATSRYNFDTKGWTPRPTITIDCVEIEIAPDNWIMAVDANNTNLLLLNAYYNIQWEECSCLRGIRLEDVTVELEEEVYEEMRHNI